MTTQESSAEGLSTLVGGLLTVGALSLAAMAALLSTWLTPVAGAALLVVGWIGLRTPIPRVLALITIAFGLVLPALALLAFLPA